MKKNELSYNDLKVTCDPNTFNFKDTSELESTHTEIGQDRGIKALEFGVNVNIKGYNLYLEGFKPYILKKFEIKLFTVSFGSHSTLYSHSLSIPSKSFTFPATIILKVLSWLELIFYI